MNKQTNTISAILKRPLYGTISLVTSIGFGILYYYLTLSIVPFSLAAEMVGPVYLSASVGLTFVVAILAGINVSMVIFKIKSSVLINVKKSSSSTTFGSVLAVFTPGCPACATPLAAIFGTVGGLAAFPLLGLEFKIISIGSLVFSIFWLTRKLNRANHCRR